MKRILSDIKQAKNLEDCGIFISYAEDQASEVEVELHAVIAGVADTPYQAGFFHFTLLFPSNYPLAPPRVTLRTTGNGTVRFNPNLYSCGKVCLSILGTWRCVMMTL
jgi:ubiquitin-protein ligase